MGTRTLWRGDQDSLVWGPGLPFKSVFNLERRRRETDREKNRNVEERESSWQTEERGQIVLDFLSSTWTKEKRTHRCPQVRNNWQETPLVTWHFSPEYFPMFPFNTVRACHIHSVMLHAKKQPYVHLISERVCCYSSDILSVCECACRSVACHANALSMFILSCSNVVKLSSSSLSSALCWVLFLFFPPQPSVKTFSNISLFCANKS